MIKRDIKELANKNLNTAYCCVGVMFIMFTIILTCALFLVFY